MAPKQIYIYKNAAGLNMFMNTCGAGPEITPVFVGLMFLSLLVIYFVSCQVCVLLSVFLLF